MQDRLDSRYIAGSIAIALTSHTGGLKNLLWQNTLRHTFADMTVTVIDIATTHVYVKYGKAGGSGPWGPTLL